MFQSHNVFITENLRKVSMLKELKQLKIHCVNKIL